MALGVGELRGEPGLRHLEGQLLPDHPAAEVIKAFLNAKFSNAERHVRRRDKVTAIETEYRGQK